MSSIYPLVSSWTNGEISPLLASRVDIDLWRTSLASCVNFQVLTHGVLRRRSGTRFIAEARDGSKPTRLFSFKFSELQSYILAFNDGRIRFLAQRGTVGAPYEITHPWADADLDRLSYSQFNDVSYFAHKDYAPKRLSRLADANWTLVGQEFKDGPYLPLKTDHGTVLKPSARGSISPIMTSNTAPSGVAADSDGSAEAYKVFDGSTPSSLTVGGLTGWVAFTPDTAKVADAYWVGADDASPQRTPSNWKFEGYDGTAWVALDSRSTENGWVGGEVRFYEFPNETAFITYRLRWTATSGSSSVSGIGELGIHEAGDGQTAFDLTASSASGINEGAGFLPSDVARAIRLKGSDGRWRWARIVSRTSSTVVTIKLYGHALPDTSPIASWQLGALSGSSGFPACVTLYDERLMWANTDTEPVSVYGSRQGTFDEYGISDPPVATDGIKITLLSSGMNEILWLADDDDLVTGSAGQIRTIGPSDITQSFSATNLAQRKGPTTGAAHLRPISIGGTTIYVGAGGTKIRELVLGEQNRYVAPELSVLAEHLFVDGIVDWAYSERPLPTIYTVRTSGELIAITYDRDQKVLGFARHDVGGVIERVAVIPGVKAGYEDVYLTVRRIINDQTKRYYEVLERPFDPIGDVVEDAFFVDCGLTYEGAPAATVSGLDHLEGEAVSALADGSVINNLVVSGGQITLPASASKVHVGLPFTSRAVTMPVAGPGRDGTLFGRRKQNISCSVDVLAAGALKVGSDQFEAFEILMRDGGGLFTEPLSLKTGWHRCDLEGSWANAGQIVMETAEALPCIIRALMLQSEFEP